MSDTPESAHGRFEKVATFGSRPQAALRMSRSGRSGAGEQEQLLLWKRTAFLRPSALLRLYCDHTRTQFPGDAIVSSVEAASLGIFDVRRDNASRSVSEGIAGTAPGWCCRAHDRVELRLPRRCHTPERVLLVEYRSRPVCGT